MNGVEAYGILDRPNENIRYGYTFSVDPESREFTPKSLLVATTLEL